MTKDFHPDEIANSKRIQKSATPKHDVSWYVKWIAMMLCVLGVFLTSGEMYIFGQFCYFVSAIGWIYVGVQWSDRAIMIGSAVSCTAIAMNLVNTLT